MGIQIGFVLRNRSLNIARKDEYKKTMKCYFISKTKNQLMFSTKL